MYLLCAGMMIQEIFAVGQPLLTMTVRPHLHIKNLIWLGSNAGLNVALIPHFGFVAALIAKVLARRRYGGACSTPVIPTW